MVAATIARPPVVADIDAALGEDTLARLAALFAAHGDAFRVHSPGTGRNLLVLSHPDHVRHVMVDHHADFAKGIGIERVAILLGNGLMTSDGATWRAQRKSIQPAFHRIAVQASNHEIVAANRRLAARLAETSRENGSVDITRELSEVTLEIVLRAIFGASYERMVAVENPFALLTAESGRDLKFAYAFRQLGGVLQQEILQRRALLGGATDILQVMIDARDRHTGAPMPDRQIRDEVFTLIVAGHETTASALSWTWYLVARHPSVAERIREEVDGAGSEARAAPDAMRFPFVQQVIAESLRLYPPGWLLTRRARSATSITEVAVDAGDDILISPYLVHRHRDFWPDADRFDPDRFAPANADARSRFCYLPFGLGPRACIGEPLAQAEMLAHVVTLAHACELNLVAGQTVELEAKVNLRPRTAIQMKSVPRAVQ